MSGQALDITACDVEPIHIPGSIQPHGVMLVVDVTTGVITHAAGDPGVWFGRSEWLGQPLASLIPSEAVSALLELCRSNQRGGIARLVVPSDRGPLDLTVYPSSGRLVIEAEDALPVSMSSRLLSNIEAAAAAFARSSTMQQLWDAAVQEFRGVLGFHRVMLYKFRDDDSGVVVAEDSESGQRSFLNHHFPASDIPKQARALYVRNLVRTIPDVSYRPLPLVPPWTEAEPLDMSDSVLRSVSPIHIQYLKNMEVAASASISILKDGELWGLIACHHGTPRTVPPDVRAACRVLATALSREIKVRDETDAYRQRVRLRTFEDDLVSLLSRDGVLNEEISNHIDEIKRAFGADGVAVLRGTDLVVGGHSPSEEELRKLAAWSTNLSPDAVLATHRLGDIYSLAAADARLVAGLLAITISATEPWVVLWFRAEELEVINWAGNPHKSVSAGPEGALTPRTSFNAFVETVRGQSREWTIPEVEAANRLRLTMNSVYQSRRIRELNRELMNTVQEKDSLIRQKDFLMGEVNHRVQNSLQLVSGFLRLQSRASDDASLNAAIDEACRRIAAVSLVHRRLYRADQIEIVDAARYLDELLDDLVSSMGADWGKHLVRDLAPAMLLNERAVALGLVVTELVINANKYAYGGAPGRLRVTLTQDGNRLRLIVADEGVGRGPARKGFGSRIIEALVGQLHGTLEYQDARPGTRAVLTFEAATSRKR